jgi:hypothetical protein
MSDRWAAAIVPEYSSVAAAPAPPNVMILTGRAISSCSSTGFSPHAAIRSDKAAAAGASLFILLSIYWVPADQPPPTAR